MTDPEVTEAFEKLRELTPEFAHELVDVLERRLVVAETIAKVALEHHLAHVEMDEYSRKVVDGPSDDQVYNRANVEGGIGYTDEALGEHDWRL